MPAAPAELFRSLEGLGHVALAVSGGSDSMAMLRLAHAWGGAKLSILTVDHGLRAASAGEAAQVALWCEGLGLAHSALRWDGPHPASGLQAKARQARYDLMSRWCHGNGATALLTGHTLDDQAETVLMRMARTSSIDSLAGIYREGQWAGLRLLRPLLGERRQALRNYLTSLGQPWIDDPSNEDERFERVRIRKAMPVLESLGIRPEGLAGFAAELRVVTEGLWGATEQWVNRHVQRRDEGYCTFPLAAFADQTEVLKPRILGWLVSRYGGGAFPGPQELSSLALWVDAGGTRRTLGGAVLARRRDTLLIGREAGRIDAAAVPVPASGKLIWDRRFEITTEPGAQVVPAVAVAGLPRRRDIPAFVQAGLPAVIRASGEVAVPQLLLGYCAAARFLPDLRR